MKKLGAAIVGCGWVADWHVTDGIAQLPEQYALVACCDTDQSRAEAFATRHGAPAICTSLDELLQRDDVDVVILCTPPMLHFKMILSVLQANKHVVCEKPFCASLAQLDEIETVEKASRGRVMPIFQYRFGDGLARVRHVIQSGLAGKHYVSSVETAKRRGPDYYNVPWRGKFASELGGVLLTQAIHNHDLLNWLLGPAQEVSCFKTTRVNPIEVEDCAVVNMRLHDGSLASSTSTLGSSKQTTRFRLCFENVTFEQQVFDSNSRKIASDPWIIVPANEAIGREIEQKANELSSHSGWFVRQYELFHAALQSGGEFPVTLGDARVSLELITACFLSDERRVAVTLPIDANEKKYQGWIPTA